MDQLSRQFNALPSVSLMEQFVSEFETYRGRLYWSGFWLNSNLREFYSAVLLLDDFSVWTTEKFTLDADRMLDRSDRAYQAIGFRISQAVRAINFSYRAYHESRLWC